MSNWAVIIGINNYDESRYLLNRAVGDALSFLNWCIDPKGGNVPPANVSLLLDDKPGSQPAIPGGVQSISSASRDEFVNAVASVLKDSGGSGDRFFFYFAGHGLTVRSSGTDVSSICFRNFTPTLTNNAVSLLSLFERFRATQFKEQYFLIDACRNIPFAGEFKVSDFDRPQAPSGPPFPQFIAYATQSRNTAMEGFEGGAFTTSLLDGLKGGGDAKQWDAETGEYIVRWGSLFKFVEGRVAAMKLISNIAGGVIQVPKQFGERGTEDPTLATFEEANFGKEVLEVDLDPKDAASDVKLVFGEYGQITLEQQPPITPVPLKVSLMPRIYSIVAKGTRYRSKRRLELVELYASQSEPVKIELELVPPGPTPGGPSAVSRGIADVIGVLTAGAKDLIDTLSTGAEPDEKTLSGTGDVTSAAAAADSLPRDVSTPDALAQLEIAHQSGRIVASGRGLISLPPGSDAGFYRARVIAPDGSADQTLIEMSSDGHGRPVTIVPKLRMTRGLSWATERAGIGETPDHLLMPSEAIGEAAFVKLSTLLALAAGARAEGNQGSPGGKLRSIPLPPSDMKDRVNEFHGGIQVVLGDENMEMDWRGTTIAFSPERKPEREFLLDLQVSDQSQAVASADVLVDPGRYWLHIHAEGVTELTLAITVLPSRISLVVITLEADRSLDLHQYSLLVMRAGEPTPWLFMDPRYNSARFAVIRRIELMQRTYRVGRTEPSLPDIQNLLYSKWIDPVAGCLGGYILVGKGRSKDLGEASQNLCSNFGGLPDAWVLRAAYEEAVESPNVEQAVSKALDAGIPTFAEGVRDLGGLASRWVKSDERTEVIAALGRRTSSAGGLFTGFDQTTFREVIVEGFGRKRRLVAKRSSYL